MFIRQLAVLNRTCFTRMWSYLQVSGRIAIEYRGVERALLAIVAFMVDTYKKIHICTCAPRRSRTVNINDNILLCTSLAESSLCCMLNLGRTHLQHRCHQAKSKAIIEQTQVSFNPMANSAVVIQ